ncbi:hypothetical protein [Nocardiopsis sp. SBT366]|uniref:hypothetical protein n=1 Tax=Nocardiopsis sp. SBT366 TaxID=1580529 RepID=UPI00066CC52C|nr:hypothetical protein [Nocardiopsis sp. SBT366]
MFEQAAAGPGDLSVLGGKAARQRSPPRRGVRLWWLSRPERDHLTTTDSPDRLGRYHRALATAQELVAYPVERVDACGPTGGGTRPESF